MDLTELLRSQAKRYRCGACNENMADCGINVLAQQGNRALVRVTCAACRDENLLQIIFQTDDEADVRVPARTAVADEGFPETEKPISGDELLDLHTALTGWQGGFEELLKPRE